MPPHLHILGTTSMFSWSLVRAKTFLSRLS
jgi:hypothetical protein